MTRSQHDEQKIREFAHIFQRCIYLLERYYSSKSYNGNSNSFDRQPDHQLRQNLLHRVENHYHLVNGFMGQVRQLEGMGAHDAAEAKLDLAEYYQVRALILSSAARKANKNSEGKVLNQRIDDRILYLRRSIQDNPSNREHLKELQNYLDIAEERNWQRSDGSDRIVTFFGATWCSDTANVVDIMGCFSLPMHMLIIDKDNQSEDGFLKYNPHSYNVFRHSLEDEFLRIPVMIFPDGSRMVEPDMREFIKELVIKKLM